MAKAAFQIGQRVFVRPVGAWAKIERVAPVWAQGLEAPLRIVYDCGLGREFAAQELEADGEETLHDDGPRSGVWRVMRAANRLRPRDQAAAHPQPGTHPVVVTAANDWGGWRASAAEYDLDPERIERQARLIAAAPRLKRVAERLRRFTDAGKTVPRELAAIAEEAAVALDVIEGFEHVWSARDGAPPPPAACAREPAPEAPPSRAALTSSRVTGRVE